MTRRSLRDEMIRGVPRRKRKRMWPLAVTGLVVVTVGVMAISALGQPDADVGAHAADSSVSDADTEPAASNSDADEGSVTSGDPAPSESGAPSETGDAEASQPPAEQTPSGPAGDVRASVDALEVIGALSTADYDRALFGQAWYDLDRNGCDTRNDILRRDLHDLVLKENTNGCKVLAGVLDDWYSGTTVDFTSGSNTSRLVQVDHVVPLSWAWRRGADTWEPERRLAFANDPLNLVATTDAENMSKSDSGPADWLPTADSAQCRYVQRFTAVLSEYKLPIDRRNRAMIRGVLTECEISDAFGAFATSAELAAAADMD